MIGQTIAHYRITAKLGAGGMGEVYRATDTKLGREVAIKVLPEAFASDADRMARFQREAQVLAALNHPNIAQIYGVEDRALVMELVEGEALRGPLPLETALGYARQIADALEAAHDKGIVHRDLKPANIMITPAGTVKVLDFGLAAVAIGTPSDATQSPTLTLSPTRMGMILGTASYMSPEQAAGKPVDKRADIWSFGAVLWEMVTGEQLFQGETVSHILAAVLKDQPDLTRAPAKVRRLLSKCLEKDPKKRLRDIGDAWELLDDDKSGRAPQPVRRRSWMWPSIACILVAVLVFMGFVHFGEKVPTAPLYQYTVALPSGLVPQNLALSHDGRSLAIWGASPDRASLWVKHLDSLELKELKESSIPYAGSASPFWSPDGRSIFFIAANFSLRRISAAGGPPEQVAADLVAANHGSSIDSAGNILLGSGRLGIVRVQDGKGVVVRNRFARKDQELLRYPELLQDGQRFLYSITTGSDARIGVYLADLNGKSDGSADRRILSDATAVRYVPPGAGESAGSLFFVRSGTLLAQSVDPGSLAAVGEAMPLATPMRVNGNMEGLYLFAVSSSGTLVYAAGEVPLRLDWLDRAGKQIASESQGTILSFSLAPDGKRVAIARRDRSSNSSIFIRDLANGTETHLGVSEMAPSLLPVWSPDGERIYFASRRGNQGIYVKTFGSSEPERELETATNLPNYPGDWTPDGKYMVFLQGGDIYAVAPGQKRIPIVEGRGYRIHARVSPDGRWLAYTSIETPAASETEVYVQPLRLDGKQATRRKQISSGGGSQPRWNSNGRELFFVSQDQRLMCVEVKPGAESSFETPTALFDLPSLSGGQILQQVVRYEVAPGGKRFLVLRSDPGAVQPPLTIVTNWRRLLKK